MCVLRLLLQTIRGGRLSTYRRKEINVRATVDMLFHLNGRRVTETHPMKYILAKDVQELEHEPIRLGEPSPGGTPAGERDSSGLNKSRLISEVFFKQPDVSLFYAQRVKGVARGAALISP